MENHGLLLDGSFILHFHFFCGASILASVHSRYIMVCMIYIYKSRTLKNANFVLEYLKWLKESWIPFHGNASGGKNMMIKGLKIRWWHVGCRWTMVIGLHKRKNYSSLYSDRIIYNWMIRLYVIIYSARIFRWNNIHVFVCY